MANLASSLFVKNTNFSYRHGFLSATQILKPPPDLLFAVPESGAHFDSRGLLKWKSRSNLFPASKTARSPDESGDCGSSSDAFNFDDFLSVLEFTALVSAAAISIYVASNCLLLPNGGILGTKILVVQCALLFGCVVVGTVIRRRQWQRIAENTEQVDLPLRVEKLAVDLRSAAAILPVLNRQIEKLGTRIRDNRKTFKDPILQTNSQKIRALVAERELLGRELVEIQNLLLALQEQQRKQLELILAVGKAMNLWGARKEFPEP